MPRLRRLRARRGVAAVELALLLPLLALLFVLAVDFARIFYYSIIVTNCARNGAIYGCQDPTRALDTAGIDTAAKKDATNLPSVTVTSAADSNTTPTYVDVTVSYPFSTITRFPGVTSTFTIVRKVRMNVSPLTPD